MVVTLASLMVKIGADVDQAVKGLKDTDDAFERNKKSAEGFDKALTRASIVGTAALGAMGTAAIFTAAEFEKGLDQVGAVSGATEADLARLRKEALAIGADTAFGAGQALAAMEELAAGGRSVEQILVEARASADLAAAGNYNLADSARTVATTMDIWRTDQLQTNEVINRLAGAANVSRFGVEDMAQAIAMGGGAAAIAGVDFADFTTTIALTAAAFSSGSDAGTSFKTFVAALPGNSKEAKDAIKALGLEFFDASGNMRSMAEITDELRLKLGPLSEEQQIVALKTIFGNDAMRTAAGLIRSTAGEYEAMSAILRDTDAADVAAQRMGNLHGDIEELKGSLETLAIAFGTQALPALSEAAQAATGATNAFGELPMSTQNVIAGFLGITVAIPALVAGTGKVVSALGLVGESGLTMRSKLALAAATIGVVATSLDALSQHTTGVGIFERMFGDVSRSQAAAEAMQEWNAILDSAGPEADRAALALANFDSILSKLPETFEQGFNGGAVGGFFENMAGQLSDLTGLDSEFHDAIDATKEWEERVKAAGAAMVAAGADGIELARAYHALHPAMREAFDEATNIEFRMTTAAFAMESARNASDGWMGSIQDLIPRERELADMTGVGEEAIGSWERAMRIAIDTGDDFDETLKNLIGTYSDMNPQADVARFKHAELVYELEQLKLKGDDLNETEKARIKLIEEELLPASAAVVKAYDVEKQAAGDFQEQVVKLLGPEGYGGLKDAMDAVGKSGPEQNAVWQTLGQAYNAFTEGDLATLMAKFDELRLSLDDAEWRAITESAGYAQVSGYVEGINRIDIGRELHDALIEPVLALNEEAGSAGWAVGDALIRGMAGGLLDPAAKAAVVAHAGQAMDDAIEALRASGHIYSPSQRTAEEVGLPLSQGIAVGILAGQQEILDAAGSVVDQAIAIAQAEMDAFIATVGKGIQINPEDWDKPIGGSGVTPGPDYGGSPSPYDENGNLKGVEGANWVFDPKRGGWVLEQVGKPVQKSSNTGAYGTQLVFDPATDAVVYPWDANQGYGNADRFQSPGTLSADRTMGSPTIQIEHYHAGGVEGDMVAGDLMYAMGKKGLL